MRRAVSVATFVRQEAVLALCISAAAALFGLGEWLGITGMTVSAAVVLAGGACCRLVIGVRRSRLEGRRNDASLARALRVYPACNARDADPVAIGIDRAEQSLLPGATIPSYVPREADESIDIALRRAADGSGPWVVVVHGVSKVGKSRTLFEGVRSCIATSDYALVAPVDAAALQELLLPGSGLPTSVRGTILWLDDLEPFVNGGITFRVLEEWRKRTARCVVVATYGGKGGSQVALSPSPELPTMASELLDNAAVISLQQTSSEELAPILSRLADGDLRAVQKHGLAAYLVAGRKIELKLNTAIHLAGEPACPAGVAAVKAVADWARCGRTDGLPALALRDLWPSYLPQGVTPSDDVFTQGLEWACRPVAGTIALLEGSDVLVPYDYVVRLLDGAAGAVEPEPATRRLAIETATDSRALGVGYQAFFAGRKNDALVAFSRAHRSVDSAVAAAAFFATGVTFSDLDQRLDAIAAFGEVVSRFGDAAEPALRVQVARALINKGITLRELDQCVDAIAVYGEVVSRFGDATEPELRGLVAMALVEKGIAFGRLERWEDAVAVYGEVVSRFGDATEPALRVQVAKALVNKGGTFDRLDRWEDAVALNDEVVSRFGDATESELRVSVARALVNKGITLGERDEHVDAMAIFDEVVSRFGDATESELRVSVARALVNKGGTLAERDEHVDAMAIFDEVVSRFGDAGELELRPDLARALVNKGIALVRLKRVEDAVAVCVEVVSRFGDAAEPELRVQVDRARSVQAGRLGVGQAPPIPGPC